MATRNELLTLFKAAMLPSGNANFSAEDANTAAINAIVETYGLQNASVREIRARQNEVFSIIEEAVDELLPKAITDVMGAFADVRTFARDAEPVFEIRGVGKTRARMSIIEGARAGIYKARRLDDKIMQVPVKVETVGLFVTLEEIMMGTISLGELMTNIVRGFQERVYIKCIEALRTAKTLAPAANIKSGNGFVSADIDALVRIAKAYGTPVIMGFSTAISKINNGTGWSTNPNAPAVDTEDIRRIGHVTQYKGTPVVEIPNYLADETNANFVFKEGDLFILPTEAKPVKVALKGETHMEEFKHPSGSIEQNVHRMLGVGLMLANNVCIYTDSGITGGLY